jgi:hypothetical protein
MSVRKASSFPNRGSVSLAQLAASRLARLLALAVLVTVAGSAVGAASRPHQISAELSPPDLTGLTVLSLLAVAALTGVMAGSMFGAPAKRPDREYGERNELQVPLAVKILVPLAALALAVTFRLWAVNSSEAARVPSGPGVPIAVPPQVAATGGDLGLILACVAVGIAGVVVAAVLFRKPVAAVSPPVPREGISAILDEGLGALLAEDEPRRAVIAAYVAMERAMARQGWARRPAESPTEFMARVLHVAPTRTADLNRLVTLYELARFSEHDITLSMRDDARLSVHRLRADLETSR